jgi:predicted CoA-binding protein|tara:strand:+ start:3433 stop:3798 length:366 start_codon:yes stop_codon:yes gene_type:complete
MTQKPTLVFGASLHPERYSNIAIHRLRSSAIETRAFGLKKGCVSGVVIDTNLPVLKEIHTVTMYLNPKHQTTYYNYIIGLNPKRVLFNPGTENPDFYKHLRKASIDYEVACTLVLLSTHQY